MLKLTGTVPGCGTNCGEANGADQPCTQARRALLILSDGLDNYSRYSESELMRVALEADVQVYSIIMNTGTGLMSGGTVPFRPSMAMKPADQARERQGPNLLEKLSTQTGGLYFHVKGEAEAREAAAKISLAIRNEYMIGYRPVDSGLSGKWHRVKVKSTVPKVNVYAREGYYAR